MKFLLYSDFIIPTLEQVKSKILKKVILYSLNLPIMMGFSESVL